MRRKSPHIGNHTNALHIDYNGAGIWSVEGIQKRYKEYASAANVKPQELIPRRHIEGERMWVFPLMEQVIERIEHGDEAAIEIGIDFIMEDDFFVFGSILKSNTARSLRRVSLSQNQQKKIRERLIAMLLSGQVPREWREYKRLLKAVGIGSLWPVLESGIDRQNQYVMRYYTYLDEHARPSTETSL
jgi:hypothetical protein